MTDVATGSSRVTQGFKRLRLECLDHVWRGTHAKYRFRCKRGHEFVRVMASILPAKKNVCSECRQMDQDARLLHAASKAGVQCLEAHYLGPDHLHRFRCRKKDTMSASTEMICVLRKRRHPLGSSHPHRNLSEQHHALRLDFRSLPRLRGDCDGRLQLRRGRSRR